MLYVAMALGCFECGKASHCLGVFESKDDAEAACAAAEQGQHSFEVFEVEALNVARLIEYDK